MKGLTALFLGIFGALAFSWAGLVWIPNMQIGHLDPQTDEDGNDAYPAPRSGMAERGRKIYVANGCVYCHSQQVRADYAASDIERKWGDRRSAPRDYIFDRPVLLGKMRLGPDLANEGHRAPVGDENAAVGGASPAPGAAPAASAAASPAGSPAASASPATAVAAASPVASPAASPAPVSATKSASPTVAQNASPAASASPAAGAETATVIDGQPLPYTVAWHLLHLYDPRSLVRDSNMPSYAFLYTKRKVSGERAADALVFPADSTDAPPVSWEVVPTYEARCLVAYLMSLDQSHALKEVKTMAAAAPAAPGKEVK